MDPTIPDFVPSFAAAPASHTTDKRGRKNGAFPASPSMNLANLEHAKPAEPANNSNHVRSHSVPSGPASSQRGARGSAVRGRGSLRGRGGRGGASGIPVHQSHSAAKPASPPPISLDSVQDFPALGGKSSESSTSSSPTAEKHASTSTSPIHEKDTMSKSQSMSFARIVAPAPPPDHQPQPQPASNHTAAAHSLPGASFAAAARSASAPSTNTSSKPSSVTASSSAGSSEKNASSPPSSHSPEPHEINQAQLSSQATPVARKGSKKGARQPHAPPHNLPFHPEQNYPHQPYQEPLPPPAPVLSATQIAFLQANGLSVEGLPAVAAATNASSASDAPYPQPGPFAQGSDYPYQPPAEGSQGANGLARSASDKHFAQHSQHPPQQHLNKHARKLSRREYDRQMQDYYATWGQQNQFPPYNPDYQGPLYENGQAPIGQSTESANGAEDVATPMTRSLSLGSSHLSVAAPSFVPSFALHDSHLHADAKPFEPSFTKSPRFNGDAGSFVPALPTSSEETSKEEQGENMQGSQQKETSKEDVAHPEEQPSDVGLSGEDAITPLPSSHADAQESDGTKEEVEFLPVVQSKASEVPVPDAKPTQEQSQVEDKADPSTQKEEGKPTSLLSDLASKAKEVVEDVVDAVSGNADSATNEDTESSQRSEEGSSVASTVDEATAPATANGEATNAQAEAEKEEPLSAEAFQDVASSARTPVQEDTLQEEASTLAEKEPTAPLDADVQNSEPEETRISTAHPSASPKDVKNDNAWPEQYGGDDGAFREPVVPEPVAVQEQADRVEEGQKSPPHSSFSLLPAPSVDEVLEKAKNLFGIETAASQGNGSVEPKAESDDATDDATSTSNKEADAPSVAEVHSTVETAEGVSTQEEVKANLDELDLGDEEEVGADADAAGPTISTTGSSIEDELPQPSHSQQSSASQTNGSLGEPDLSQHSLSPSEVETALLSPGGLDDYAEASHAEALEEEIARAAKQNAEPAFGRNDQNLAPDNSEGSNKPAAEEQEPVTFEIISSSDNRCVMENETATSAEQDSDNSRPVAREPEASVSGSPQFYPVLQSQNAPSKVEPAHKSETSETSDQSSITSSNEVVQAPSERESEEGRTARSSAPSPPSTTSPLPALESQSQSASTSRQQQYQLPPKLQRMPSQAEKEEAIRLVAELRSEPSTPAAVDSDYPDMSTVGQPSGSATPNNNGFSFDIADKLKELSSSKRKRGKQDADREPNEDHPKRKKDDEDDDEEDDKGKKPSQDGAPSLTLSIFSGSILPRKQLILSIFASFGINLLLPFVNGVMLGFGEIFARDWLGPFFGLPPPPCLIHADTPTYFYLHVSK